MKFKYVVTSIIVNLTKPLDELWEKLDKDARWGVNKARKEGLIIEEAKDENEQKEYYNIYRELCKKQNIKEHIFTELKNPSDFKGRKHFGRIFLCKKQGEMIAGASTCENSEERKFSLFTNASKLECLKFQPNNLLYWHLIEWGKKNGFEIFDLGGYMPEAKKGDKIYEVNRFKLRWGGDIKEYEAETSNFLYFLGRKIIVSFPILRKFKNRFFKK
jgi:lipid II:glycine glycyltransferase (peptidoglycan interpeptide bridge formation enzyme)